MKNNMDNNGITKTLGSVVASARNAKGITQRELAREVKVSNSTISRIESDDGIQPDPRTLQTIAQNLDLDYNYLLALNGQLEDQPEVRMIQRAARKMSQADLNKMMKVLNTVFDQAFTEEKAGSDTDINTRPVIDPIYFGDEDNDQK